MKDRNAFMALLLFSVFFLRLSAADPQPLQYLYTGITLGIHFPQFTAVRLFDGEQFVCYDSNIRKMIPKTEWIQKITADDPHYWSTEIQKRDQEIFKIYLQDVIKAFNQTEGVHTLQRMYGCEINDDGTTRGYDQYAYDGEDFFSLDLNTGTWTAVNDESKNFINKWDSIKAEDKYRKNDLQTECISWIKKFMSYSRETVERKVPPTASVFQKHSSPPDVVCHATGFFPKALNISWQKDGEEVHKNLSKELPNQDGSFQKRSVLKVSAEDLQKHTYTCVIQHSSLEKEMVLEVPKGGGADGGAGGGLTGIVVGAGVALILITIIVVIVLWKKKKTVSPLSTPPSIKFADDTVVVGLISNTDALPTGDLKPGVTVPREQSTPERQQV